MVTAAPTDGSDADAANHGLLSVVVAGILAAVTTFGLLPVFWEALGMPQRIRLTQHLDHEREVREKLTETSELGKSNDWLQKIEKEYLGATSSHLGREVALGTNLRENRAAAALMFASVIAKEGEHAALGLRHFAADLVAPYHPSGGEVHASQFPIEQSAHEKFRELLDESILRARKTAATTKQTKIAAGEFVKQQAVPAAAYSRLSSASDVDAFFTRTLEHRTQPYFPEVLTVNELIRRYPGVTLGEGAKRWAIGEGNRSATLSDRVVVWHRHTFPEGAIGSASRHPEGEIAAIYHSEHAPAAHRTTDGLTSLTKWKIGDWRAADEYGAMIAPKEYGLFRTGGVKRLKARVTESYATHFRGAAEIFSTPKVAGGIMASLVKNSIPLSALLYGVLYLVEYYATKHYLEKGRKRKRDDS